MRYLGLAGLAVLLAALAIAQYPYMKPAGGGAGGGGAIASSANQVIVNTGSVPTGVPGLTFDSVASPNLLTLSGRAILGSAQTAQGVGAQDSIYVGYDDTTSVAAHGITNVFQYDGTGSVSTSKVALAGNAFTGSTSTGSITLTDNGGFAAGRFIVQHRGAGTLAKVSGLSTKVSQQNGTSGVVTSGAGFNAESPAVGAGQTWASEAGLWVLGGSVNGTITTRYGIIIDDLVGGTTRYGIYQAGVTDSNYLAGPTTIAGNVVDSNGVSLVGVAQPTCSSSIPGKVWYSGHTAGVKDSVAVCASDAANSFAWRTIY